MRRRWSRCRPAAGRSCTSGWPRPVGQPGSGTRTSPRWPPGREPTRRWRRRWTRPPQPRTPGRERRSAGQFAAQAVRVHPRLGRRGPGAAPDPRRRAAVPGRRGGTVAGRSLDGARHRRGSPRKTWSGSLPLLADMTELLHGDEPAAAHRHPLGRRPPAAIPGGARWRWRWPPTPPTASAAAGVPPRPRRSASAEAAGPAGRRVPAPGPAQPGGGQGHRGRGPGLLSCSTGPSSWNRSCQPGPLHDTADLNRGLWSRYTDDLDTARAALRRCIARARDAGEDYAAVHVPVRTWPPPRSWPATTGPRRRRWPPPTQAAAWHDWPPSPWHLEPRCDLLIASRAPGRSARHSREERLPDDANQPPSHARSSGPACAARSACWRGDAAAAVRHLERAARCARRARLGRPRLSGRGWITLLAESYLSGGRAGRGAARSRPGCADDRPAAGPSRA